MVSGLDPEIARYYAAPAPRGRPPPRLVRVSSGGRLVYGLALATVGVLVGFVAIEDPAFVVPTALASGLLLGLPIALVARRMRRRDRRVVSEGQLVEAEVLARTPTLTHTRGRPIPAQSLRLGVAGDPREFGLVLADAWLRERAVNIDVGARLPMIVCPGERQALVLLADQPQLVYAAA